MDVKDTTDRLAWGWLAVLHNIEPGEWRLPTEASRLIGVPAYKLRYWADQGVITCIHLGHGRHRRYLVPELELVRRLTGSYPTLIALKHHVDIAMKYGLSTERR